MSVEYASEKYVNIDDALTHLGFTKEQQNAMNRVDKARYLSWTREANNKVEAALFPFSDVIPLTPTSKEFTFARSAALNWVIYKKRDLAGSKNALSSKNDFDRDIKDCKELLSKIPTLKMYPIGTKATDSTADIIRPYSQTMGFPSDLLY